ncbi:hypothetical protein ACTFIU_009022 [Dictyostelium citrinum]
MKDPPKRLIRALDLISKFKFSINHIPSENNIVADIISRDSNIVLDLDYQFIQILIKIRLVLEEGYSTNYSGNLGFIQERFWDRNLVTSGVECQKNRLEQEKHGLLNPLPISARPWDNMTMDFLNLPTTDSSMDQVLLILDRLSKIVKNNSLQEKHYINRSSRVFLEKDSLVKLKTTALSTTHLAGPKPESPSLMATLSEKPVRHTSSSKNTWNVFFSSMKIFNNTEGLGTNLLNSCNMFYKEVSISFRHSSMNNLAYRYQARIGCNWGVYGLLCNALPRVFAKFFSAKGIFYSTNEGLQPDVVWPNLVENGSLEEFLYSHT